MKEMRNMKLTRTHQYPTCPYCGHTRNPLETPTLLGVELSDNFDHAEKMAMEMVEEKAYDKAAYWQARSHEAAKACRAVQRLGEAEVRDAV